MYIHYLILRAKTSVNDGTRTRRLYYPSYVRSGLEAERDFSLPANSLVDATPLPEINEKVRLKIMEIRLDLQFLTTVPAKHIQHSKELGLRKKVAQQEKTISLLTSTVELQQKNNKLLADPMDVFLKQ